MEFLIKQLSDLVGLTPRTIRYYEKEGLLPAPARTYSGYRTFGVEDMAVLLRIKRLRAIGFGLDQIRGILDAPGSPQAMQTLRELDAQLEEQDTQIRSQRSAIAKIIETGAPLDVVPEFAAGLVERMGKAYSDADEDERDKMRLEIVAALGDEAQQQRTREIMRLQTETADDPLMVTIADLDARFAQINASAPDDEAEALVAAYVTALTQLYSRMGAGTPSVQQAERGAELYDDFHADLVRRIMRAVHEQSDGVSARL